MVHCSYFIKYNAVVPTNWRGFGLIRTISLFNKMAYIWYVFSVNHEKHGFATLKIDNVNKYKSDYV